MKNRTTEQVHADVQEAIRLQREEGLSQAKAIRRTKLSAATYWMHATALGLLPKTETYRKNEAKYDKAMAMIEEHPSMTVKSILKKVGLPTPAYYAIRSARLKEDPNPKRQPRRRALKATSSPSQAKHEGNGQASSAAESLAIAHLRHKNRLLQQELDYYKPLAEKLLARATGKEIV